jgi:hypothetical protein
MPTTPETYGTQVIPTNGDISLVTKIATEKAGQIHWKPSNPLLFITGALEVKEWNYLTLSNWNVMFFAGLASIGLIINWLIFILPAKKIKAEIKDEKT